MEDLKGVMNHLMKSFDLNVVLSLVVRSQGIWHSPLLRLKLTVMWVNLEHCYYIIYDMHLEVYYIAELQIGLQNEERMVR